MNITSWSCMSYLMYMYTSLHFVLEIPLRCASIRNKVRVNYDFGATTHDSGKQSNRSRIWTPARQRKNLLPTLRSLKAKQNRWTRYASVTCCFPRIPHTCAAHNRAVHLASQVLMGVKVIPVRIVTRMFICWYLKRVYLCCVHWS